MRGEATLFFFVYFMLFLKIYFVNLQVKCDSLFDFRMTGLEVLNPDGSRHHRIDVIPDVLVTPTIKGLREGRDEVLERVIELVKARW
jgi:hypothetical protein